MTRSQMGFIRGVLGKVVMILSPSALNTSPNAAVKTGSRSWIRNPACRGGHPGPAARRISHTVDAAIAYPSCTGSP